MTRHLPRLAAVLCALALIAGLGSSTSAAREPVTVRVAGSTLRCDVAPFLENGTTYVPLSAFARAMGTCTVTWDGSAARVSATGLELTAQPGEQWVEANGRCLYVPGRVRLVEGRTMVPAAVLARIYGAQVEWDGRTSTVTVSAQGRTLTPGESYYSADDLYWLSRIISAESRGEPLEGQIAVGNVVLNRVKSAQYPNTIREVVFDEQYGVQFEPVSNGTVYLEPTASSVRAAKLCLEGANVVGECLYFFAPALSAGSWIVNNCTYYTTIGCHRFYR